MAPSPGVLSLPAGPLAPFLVALGAVPGAWLRHRIVQRLAPRLGRRHWATLVVNLLACFGLGVLVAAGLAARPFQAWEVLVVSGFLGSFSTFSSLAADLHGCVTGGERRQALLLTLSSLLGGWVALQLGQLLGRGGLPQ